MDDEVFKICLEFYHHFSQDLYKVSVLSFSLIARGQWSLFGRDCKLLAAFIDVLDLGPLVSLNVLG